MKRPFYWMKLLPLKTLLKLIQRVQRTGSAEETNQVDSK